MTSSENTASLPIELKKPKYPWGDNCSIPPKYRWKPGQTGNPQGRPKDRPRIPEILRKIGEGKVKDFAILSPRIKNLLLKLGEDITVEEARQALNYAYAMKGESWANVQINERTEGKIATTVKLDFNPEEVQAMLNGVVNGEEPEPDSGAAAHVDDQHPS